MTYPDLPELPGVPQQDLVHLRLGLDHPLPLSCLQSRLYQLLSPAGAPDLLQLMSGIFSPLVVIAAEPAIGIQNKISMLN